MANNTKTPTTHLRLDHDTDPTNAIAHSASTENPAVTTTLSYLHAQPDYVYIADLDPCPHELKFKL